MKEPMFLMALGLKPECEAAPKKELGHEPIPGDRSGNDA
jgi:hypothetical protein